MKLTLEKMKQKISDVKLKNSLLKYENKTLKQILDSAVSFCIIDKDNNVMEVNSTFCKHFGFDRKNILGRKCYNIWLNNICKTPGCPLEVILSGKKLNESEVYCGMPDGRHFISIVTAKPYRSSEGELLGITESFVDINERKKAEDMLREQQARMLNLQHRMPVLMIAFDKKKRIIMWNNECVRITGFSTDEILDNPNALKMLYPDEKYRRLVVDKLTHPVNDYQNWEFDVFCKNGSCKTIAWSNISVSYPVAGFSSWVIGIDVTDRTSSEKILRMREHELMNKTAELEDMNTALQVIIKKGERDKEEFKRNILLNFDSVIKPVFEDLLATRLTGKQKNCIQSSLIALEKIISPFAKELLSLQYGLTPTEIMVANYIREGKISKEIADILGVSKRTVDVHRTHIRKKIGPNLEKTNLRAFLMTLS